MMALILIMKTLKFLQSRASSFKKFQRESLRMEEQHSFVVIQIIQMFLKSYI